MKLSGRLYFTLLALVLLVGCDKKDKLQYFKNGTAPRLLVSASVIAANSADSNVNVLSLRWSDPDYSTDTSNVKFLVQIDSLGKNFSNALERTVYVDSIEFTAGELNSELISRGFRFEREQTVQIRVVSSYLNNNDPLESNVVTLKITPYRPWPKVTPPPTGRVFIVGDASDFGWSNDPTTRPFEPEREMTRVDTTTWVGIFRLATTGGYKFLYQPGDWDAQYHFTGGDDSTGTFEQRNADPAFRAAPAFGYYRITLDFQEGTFQVEPFNQQYDVPATLFIVGNATPGGLTNPVPVPSQQFTKLTSTRFQLDSLPLTANLFYTLLPVNGDWSMKFGQNTRTTNQPLSGTFAPEGGDFISPGETRKYGITIDFRNNSYRLEAQ